MAAGLLLIVAGYSRRGIAGGAKETLLNAQAGSSDGIEIRVRNASETDFQSVIVVCPGQNAVDYGAVARGTESVFRQVQTAYRYAEVRVKANGQNLSIIPIDYVGEQLLKPGRYTYVLNIQDGRLTIALQSAG